MSFQVTIQTSGHRFDVNPGESIVDAALRAGLMIPYSCRGGTCGSCLGEVLSGEVDYPQGLPPGLTAAEASSGKALFCQARARSDLTLAVREIREASQIAPRKLPCRVMKIEPLCHDVRRLYLKTPGSERLQYLPGQYIDILLGGGRRRGFSLAGTPDSSDLLELHIRRVPGGTFTGFVFEELKEGALLRLEGPFGQFYLREDSPRPLILMAGGTGFAPIKGILERAFQLGITRAMHFYWGVRSRRDLYLDDLARRWAEEHGNFRYIPVLSEPAADDAWDGRRGWVHEAVLADHPVLSGFDCYMSGPPPMIEAARGAFTDRGLPAGQLFFDAFDFATDPTSA